MQEKNKTFWSMVALAYGPTAAVLFGVLYVIIMAIGSPVFATPLFQFDSGSLPFFAGVALTFILAFPIAYGIARLMLSRGESRRLDSSKTTQLNPHQ